MNRNAPCPCGSRKKYKRCHGRLERFGLREIYRVASRREPLPGDKPPPFDTSREADERDRKKMLGGQMVVAGLLGVVTESGEARDEF